MRTLVCFFVKLKKDFYSYRCVALSKSFFQVIFTDYNC